MGDEVKIFYQRHLPHYQPPGYTFFVTFRLAGSLPLQVIQKLKLEHEGQLKLIAGLENPNEKYRSYKEVQSSYFKKFDAVLDKYRKNVSWLKQPAVADKVKEAIHYRDGKEYDLIAYSIMPNHVHMVFSIINTDSDIVGRTDCSTYIVTAILKSLKWYTALECNKILKRTGAFWQHESYDHIVRDEDELTRIIEYVLNNPVKAGLVDERNDWQWSYCKFIDEQ